MAAALAAAAKESASMGTATLPEPNREPVKSPDSNARSCESAPDVAGVQEVRLQPKQQTIVLVCGCGARTTLLISHTQAGAESAQVASPLVSDAQSAVSNAASNSVANPVIPDAANDSPASSPDSELSVVDAPTSDTEIQAGADSQILVIDSQAVSEGSASGGVTSALAVVTHEESTLTADSVHVRQPIERVVPTILIPSSQLRAMKPKFKVHELYIVRKKDNKVVFLQDSKFPDGSLKHQHEYHFDHLGIAGFKLAAPSSVWQSTHESYFEQQKCQSSGHLIVHASRRGDGIFSTATDPETLIAIVGYGWRSWIR